VSSPPRRADAHGDECSFRWSALAEFVRLAQYGFQLWIVAYVQGHPRGPETRMLTAATARWKRFAENDGDFMRGHMVPVVRHEINPGGFASLTRLEVFRRIECHRNLEGIVFTQNFVSIGVTPTGVPFRPEICLIGRLRLKKGPGCAFVLHNVCLGVLTAYS
jgi:hypothetical protein